MELIKMPEVEREGYYIGAMDDEAVDMVLQLTQKKRKTDKVTCDYKAKNLKNHLKAADKANARFCCVIGENEMKSSTVWVKDLQEKTEYSLLFEEF